MSSFRKSFGEFSPLTRAYPPVVGKETFLQLTYTPPSETDADRLATMLNGVVESISSMERALGGEGLTNDRRIAVGGSVVLELIPTRSEGADLRVEELVRRINSMLREDGGRIAARKVA